jgi:hypothetical protein
MNSVRYAAAQLRKTYNECQAANPTTSLRAGLVAKSDAQLEAVGGGEIAETSANGQFTKFNTDSDISPMFVLEMWNFLVELFDSCKATLGGNPTDAQIVTEMEKNLRPVTGYTDDWSRLQK